MIICSTKTGIWKKIEPFTNVAEYVWKFISICIPFMSCLLMVDHFPCVGSFAISVFRNWVLKALHLAVALLFYSSRVLSGWLQIQAILNLICYCFLGEFALYGLYFTNKSMLTAKALQGRRKLEASNFTSNLWSRVKVMTLHIPLFVGEESICKLRILCVFLSTVIPLAVSRWLAHNLYIHPIP